MFNPHEKKILAAVVASHGLDHLSELSFPAVALLISREFFASAEEYDRIGFAAFVAAFCFGVANLPSGRLVDRIGPRRVMLLFLLGTGSALIFVGLAPTYPLLVAALGLLGFFAGLYHPSGNTLISLGLREHGQGMGFHGMGGNLGLALSPFITTALAEALGWRGAYFALSAPFFLLAVWVGRNRFETIPLAPAAPAPRESEPAKARGYLLVPLALLFVIGTFNGLCYRGFMTFLPAYFSESIHLSHSAKNILLAGSLSTAVLLLGMGGQYLGGRLADRVSPAYLFAGIFLASAPPLFALGRLADLPLLFAAGLFAFFYFANQPVGNVLLVRFTSPAVRGRIFGMWFFVNFGIGSFMGWIAGEIGQRLELASIFGVLALCLLGSGLAALGLGWATRGKTMPGVGNSAPETS